jgi:hypothetical protein
MAKKRAGWERMLYYGVAGATASTLISYATDIDVGGAPTFADTSDRGDGTAVPKKTEQVVQIAAEVTFSVRYKDGDATIAALLAAYRTGAAVAIKVVRYSGGETEFDGDVYLEANSPGPLTDGQVIEFTGHPTDDNRAWTVG